MLPRLFWHSQNSQVISLIIVLVFFSIVDYYGSVMCYKFYNKKWVLSLRTSHFGFANECYDLTDQ